ncbi:hypothetical protein NDR87_01415 [Nocardia sp. CDC159]|uniref:Secreted protein n=1 Tax=Nocardia pulmonis TaxID=2951408 RepID=A0A9X2IWX6_9NOCA|nr:MULTISPECIES: hypothetical protein [Nocardia]MCM6772331.1 hypothetical protein [Nocardia pulmonis]MCM6785011.1 hypothetical protein [Nocardia sp. CDC159]
MRTSVKALAATLFSAAALIPVGGTAQAEPARAGCSGGELTWSVDKPISMIPRQVTFHTAGTLRDCTGVDGSTTATVAGVHESTSSCLNPADGPLTFTIAWSTGATSTVRGPWPVGMIQPTVGELDIISGHGAGRRVRIVANYNVWTPQMILGCLGPGVSAGNGTVDSLTFV